MSRRQAILGPYVQLITMHARFSSRINSCRSSTAFIHLQRMLNFLYFSFGSRLTETTSAVFFAFSHTIIILLSSSDFSREGWPQRIFYLYIWTSLLRPPPSLQPCMPCHVLTHRIRMLLGLPFTFYKIKDEHCTLEYILRLGVEVEVGSHDALQPLIELWLSGNPFLIPFIYCIV